MKFHWKLFIVIHIYNLKDNLTLIVPSQGDQSPFLYLQTCVTFVSVSNMPLDAAESDFWSLASLLVTDCNVNVQSKI